MPKSNPFFETSILNLNSSGQGIGELKGLKVFIDQALPGETVQARLIDRKKNYGLGQLEEILVSSKDRVEPICPLFSECGGCQIMHWDYKRQVVYKTEKVKNAFERIGGIKNDKIKDCIPCPDPLYYRNKILLPFFSKSGKPSMGLYKKRSHEIVEVETCYIHCPLGQKVYSTLKQLLLESSLSVYCSEKKQGFLKHLLIRSAQNNQSCLLGFIVAHQKEVHQLKELAKILKEKHPFIQSIQYCVQPKDHNVILGKKWSLILGSSFLEEKLLDFSFKIAPNAFFQVNTQQARVLYEKALELAQLKKTDQVLDAYCGIGMFSIFSAPFVKKVYGVESVAGAIRSAKQNAALNDFSHLQFECAPLEKIIHQLPFTQVVFINPPRKGCQLSVIQALLKKKPKKIIYISCDPATLARDVSLLCDSQYTLDEVQPLDLFPQTTHVESIASLSLINKSS